MKQNNNLICEFCRKTYSNKFSLVRHQKHYCEFLKINIAGQKMKRKEAEDNFSVEVFVDNLVADVNRFINEDVVLAIAKMSSNK
jgi:hypothetical protein